MKCALRLVAGFLLFAVLGVCQSALKVSPASLSFVYQSGDSKLPAAGTLSVSLTGSTTAVSLTMGTSGGPWLTASPDSGKTPVTVKVTVNPTSLSIGTHTGSVTITPAAGAPAAVVIPVTLVVKAPPASLSATPNPLTISYTRGGAAVPGQYISLSGNGTLMSYSATVSGATWLAISPSNGILFPGFTAGLRVDVDPSNLNPGTYKGTIIVSSKDASNKSQSVIVNLTVNPGGPVLTSVWPSRAVAGSGATTITLVGSNFSTNSQVSINGAAIPFAYLGSNSLQAVIPASMISSATTLPIIVSNPNPGGGDSDAVDFDVLAPGPQILGVVDGASFLPGFIAPGAMVAVFGANIGPSALTTFSLPVAPETTLATSLAGTRILFDGAPAPIIFTLSNQVVVMAPYGLVDGSTIDVVAEFNNVSSDPYPVTIAATAPSLFTIGSVGAGQAAGFNVDETTGALTLNTETAPVAKGGVVSLYGTGAGITNPGGVDGSIVGSPAPVPLGTVTATVDGQDATILYAGGAPGLIDGMMQINLRVPATVATNKAAEVIIKVGNASSPPGVTIGVK